MCVPSTVESHKIIKIFICIHYFTSLPEYTVRKTKTDIKIVTLLKLSSVYSIIVEGVGCVVDKENGLLQAKSLVAC